MKVGGNIDLSLFVYFSGRGVTMKSTHQSHRIKFLFLQLGFDPFRHLLLSFSVCFLFLQSLQKLEAKEKILQSKISTENERARDFTKSRNKKGMFPIFVKNCSITGHLGFIWETRQINKP